MKYLKLFLISVLGFSLLFLGITLLFPSVTVISRAANVKAETNITNNLGWVLSANEASIMVQQSEKPTYDAKLFNADAGAIVNGDTVFFSLISHNERLASGGVATYQLAADSTTVQLYYVFETPWYKPWEKMRMMMMDDVIGPGMDSALIRLKLLP